MLVPFLRAKRALFFFSKIVDKYYGAGLVVSENHLSGALFHFSGESSHSRSIKETWLQEIPRHGNNSKIQKKRRKGHLNKLNSYNGKHTGMFISDETKAKNWLLRYYDTFIPER